MLCALCGLRLRGSAVACPRCGAALTGEHLLGQELTGSELNDDLSEQTLPRSGLRLPEPVPAAAPVEVAPQLAPPNPDEPAWRYIRRAPAGVRLNANLIDAAVLVTAVFASLLLISAIDGLVKVSRFSPDVVSVVGWLLMLMIPAAYAVILNGRGQTIGKRAVRIVVIDRSSGAPIGIRRGALRFLVMVAMGLPLGLGYLSVPLSPTLRGWHDEAVNDLVVMRSRRQLTNRP